MAELIGRPNLLDLYLLFFFVWNDHSSKLCNLFSPYIFFPYVEFNSASFGTSLSFWGSLELENECQIDFDLKKKMASKSQIWYFHEEFYDRSQCIQKSSEALARVSQFQFGKLWADPGIKISLFENSPKWRHRVFSLDKNSISDGSADSSADSKKRLVT